jgi:hypothetical protein
MDFEKKYRITQFPGETLKAMWTRGYRNVEIYYQDKLICTHEGVAQLKKGVKYQTDELGQIELKLSAKPITLDVIIDGYHCVNNISHPAKQLKGASTFFWIIAVFALIGAFMEGVQLSDTLTLGMIVTAINLLTVTAYILAAVFTNMSKPWAFYLGFSVFCFWTLLTLLTLPALSFIFIVAFIFRLLILYLLITNIKHAVNTSRHNKFSQPAMTGDDILDSKI